MHSNLEAYVQYNHKNSCNLQPLEDSLSWWGLIIFLYSSIQVLFTPVYMLLNVIFPQKLTSLLTLTYIPVSGLSFNSSLLFWSLDNKSRISSCTKHIYKTVFI